MKKIGGLDVTLYHSGLKNQLQSFQSHISTIMLIKKKINKPVFVLKTIFRSYVTIKSKSASKNNLYKYLQIKCCFSPGVETT